MCMCVSRRRDGEMVEVVVVLGGIVVVHRCHNKSLIQLVFLVALTARH